MIALILAQTIALTGGTVYPVSGPKIDHATVVMQNGKITAVGATVTIPGDAIRIDVSGKWVTPGLIDGLSNLGLAEIDAVEGTSEGSTGKDIASSFNVSEGLNPASTLIPINRIEGVTSALATPGGGLIGGQAVLIDLDGGTIEQMIDRSPAAMVMDLSEGAKHAGNGSRAGVSARLRQVFNDALEYSRRKADYNRAQMEALSAPAADLDALLPVLRGEEPVLVNVNRKSDILTALRIAKEYKLKLILAGASEGWEVAPEIAAAGVPVLVAPMDNLPSYDGLGTRFGNATMLAKAGVKVGFYFSDSHNARDIRQQAGTAVSFGMSWDQALRAITLTPAEVYGVADRYGSLAAGKVANVVVWSGDPFEFSTAVEHVYIRGREIPLTSRQKELLDRYKTVPPSY